MYQVTSSACYSSPNSESAIGREAKPTTTPSQSAAVFDLKHKLIKCTKLSEELEQLTMVICSTRPSAKDHEEKRLQWLKLGASLDAVTELKEALIERSFSNSKTAGCSGRCKNYNFFN
ncbi:hypothetical protein [Endozoicomonas arenosclerae]|uniref:hypothetical protein n=1 Tax=Endozoicomonas arenosclerae TaxID=1633495 RepID=UPI0007850C33|nr:hypothetical protein [Endozoicomonas arenosclerae]